MSLHEQKSFYKSFFKHIELPAKLLDYLLRSNKSNINVTPSRLILNDFCCHSVCSMLFVQISLWICVM